MALLISCETGGRALPEMLFAGEDCARELDDSTIDSDGLEIAQQIATRLSVPLIENPYRRELVDVTRSLRHPKLFGQLTSSWSREKKQQLIDAIHAPYHEQIRLAITRILQQFTFTVHLSVRTFDLRVGNKLGRTDVGLLYDPSRVGEVDFSLEWIDEQYDLNPNVRVRRNYPRRGAGNGLNRTMRNAFPADQYLGIEVWMNRAWAARRVRLREEAIHSLCESLRITMGVSTSQNVA